MRSCRALLTGLLLWSLAGGAPSVLAQRAAGLSGVVVDESGGVIAGARMVLEDTDGRTIAATTTDTRGAFAFPDLPTGRTLRAEKAQFVPLRVDVTPDARLSGLRLVLKVAAVEESVDVTRSAPDRTPYLRGSATAADKMGTPILQTPFSVAVVPQQVVTDTQATRLPDVTKYVSGVQTNFGYGAQYEAFAIRGFETNATLRDGLRVSGEAGRNSVDVANIERVEVLKGPAAMLYGRIEPGGLINVVTKKPLAVPSYSLQQQVGSDNLFRTVADATGPVTASGSLLYRVVGEYQSADQFITYAPHGRIGFVAPSVTWQPAKTFDVNVNAEYRDTDPLFAGGLPAIGDRPAPIPITTYLGGDVGDQTNIVRKLANLNASYRPGAEWLLRATVATARQHYNASQFFAVSLDETPGLTYGDLASAPWFVDVTSRGTNFSLDLTGHVRAAGLEHAILVGTDYYTLDFTYQGFVNGWAPVDTTNIFSPTFHRATAYGAQAALSSAPFDWRSVGSTGWNSLYAQDQVKLRHDIQVLVGGRYDWSRATAGGLTLEYAPPGTSIDDVQETTATQGKFSPRVGVLYQPRPWMSVYGNYVQSLGTWGTQMGIAVDVDGHPLPAERSYSYEGGFKAEAFGGRVRSTVAVFNITKTNVATRDLSSPIPTALRAVGEARSSGVEVDLTGAIAPRLDVIAAYAFTDATFTKDDSGLQGHALANVPRHSGSVWLKAQITPRWFAGGGAVLRGERQGDNQNSFQLPGYATVDLFASYAITAGRTRLIPQLNVTNLTNARYFVNTNVYDSNPRLGIMPGQPRAVMAMVRWEY